MNEIIKITTTEQGEAQVSARELYDALEVKKSYRFSQWFDKNSTQLIADEDFTSVETTTEVQNNGGTQLRHLQDYSLTVDAAKQIAMMSGTEKGKQVRMYFIQVEKAWNSPDQIMARALQISKMKLEHKDKLIAEMKPKALFADAVSASQTSILVGELAKLLKQNGVEIGANRLFAWLREKGYLIRRKGTDYNMPTQRSMELELFEIKEHSHINSNGVNVTTKTPKVTGKGQQYFINKFLSKGDAA
ncbi:oxidoreductase [Leuconostoc holzapfelii]|uniref:Oxidoreductase n=1 Tax=Leuconostoc holzapfelii TaxID=434464 RepID=A0ABT2NW12_9LACO|nr:phage antirepressor KilAC domain-containing protein [Leuconostoc holzapfelii]MCT8389547.1 oxidoreductase [Leuconostoc holzapfelii]